MSIKSAVVGFLLFVGSVVCAYLLQVKMGGDVYSSRTPASEDNEIHLKSLKQEILKGEVGGRHVHTEKLRGPLRVAFDAPKSLEAPAAGDILRLNAHVVALSESGSIRVRWSLPEGVELVSGVVEEVISVTPGESLELSLEVRLLTGDNRQIHLHVDGGDGASVFGEVAQYNTVFEGMLQADAESKAEALQKLNAEQENSGSPLFKVFE